MVQVIIVLGSIWLACLAKLQAQGLLLSDVAGWVYVILVSPAILLPYLGSMRALRKRLVEPSSPVAPLYALVVIGLAGLILRMFERLSWELAILVSIPVVQLVLMRVACGIFVRRYGRLPIAIFIPGMSAASSMHAALDARGKPMADRMFALALFTLGVGPIYLVAYVFRDAA